MQSELDEFSIMWAGHRIRPPRLAPGPFGRPNFMHEVPEAFGGIDCLMTVPATEREICVDECSFREDLPCDNDVYELCRIGRPMAERDWTMRILLLSCTEVCDMQY